MCGFVGFIGPPGNRDQLEAIAKSMSDAIAHRGPDDSATWSEPDAGFAVGFRRLSILDLSPTGAQPMTSASGRFVLTMNGEIYNFEELRGQLEFLNAAPDWKGHSDTEILLACIESYGFEETLKKAVGMFSIALWDRHTKTLFLARDRFGEKPLYYGWNKGIFLFGSELKALKRHPSAEVEICRDAVSLFMRYACIPAPFTIYRGLSKLPPGALLAIPAGVSPDVPLRPQAYWSVAEAYGGTPFEGTEAEALEELEILLKRSIDQQRVADVPLGAFLSGGIDSTAIVALMQALSNKPVKTFTIGFEEAAYDESVFAREVAKRLGTDHHELIVRPQQAIDVIPQLPAIYDEPFADVSQIPTRLVSELSRRTVTVALSGDGGDEIFGGYNRYTVIRQLTKISRVPFPLRRLGGRGLQSVSPAAWTRLARLGSSMGSQRLAMRNPAEKMQKLAAAMAAPSASDLYANIVSQWKEPNQLVTSSTMGYGPWVDTEGLPSEPIAQAMALDARGYLPDDILVKVDRAAMSVSLETRAPFLDHRLAEFAFGLRPNLKLRGGRTKWILRELVRKYVPDEIMERPKTGFGLPIDTWLRSELRDWAEDLLAPKRIDQEGYLKSGPVAQLWQDHLSGRSNEQNRLWCVLMWQAWLAKEQGR